MVDFTSGGFTFHTSAIQAITGPTGPIGDSPVGTTGTIGNTGATGFSGSTGLTGVTGMDIFGTFFEEETRRWGIEFGFANRPDLETVKVVPEGFEGPAGNVEGSTFGAFNLTSGSTSIFEPTETTFGASDSGGTSPRPGVSGATLSFRTIGASGDLRLYSDGKKIGTGATYWTVGLSGPNAGEVYGTVDGGVTGMIAFLLDNKNARIGPSGSYGKDLNAKFGLLFNADDAPGLAGSTWGSVTTKYANYTELYHVHGTPFAGVEETPLTIRTDTGNVHHLHAPFILDSIETEYQENKPPIVFAPSWVDEVGQTAEYGEAINVTLIVDGGPFGISFSNKFYFSENLRFTRGKDILNCLSYDHGRSWFVTQSGSGYNQEGIPDPAAFGACCCDNEENCGNDYLTCNDYTLVTNCEEPFTFFENTLCADTPCGATDIFGSCCVNTDDFGNPHCIDNIGGQPISQQQCDRFNGTFRLVPCDPVNYPCPEPCDDGSGEDLGACCRFNNDTLQYVECNDNISLAECSTVIDNNYGIYQGDDTFCSTVDCCGSLSNLGACCEANGTCTNGRTPNECYSGAGIYMGHGSQCDVVNCDCTNQPPSIVGACCIGNLCSQRTSSECSTLGGNFIGGACFPDTCVTDPPCIPGSSCIFESDCCENELCCEGTCAPPPCFDNPPVACSPGTGDCTDVSGAPFCCDVDGEGTFICVATPCDNNNDCGPDNVVCSSGQFCCCGECVPNGTVCFDCDDSDFQGGEVYPTAWQCGGKRLCQGEACSTDPDDIPNAGGLCDNDSDCDKPAGWQGNWNPYLICCGGKCGEKVGSCEDLPRMALYMQLGGNDYRETCGFGPCDRTHAWTHHRLGNNCQGRPAPWATGNDPYGERCATQTCIDDPYTCGCCHPDVDNIPGCKNYSPEIAETLSHLRLEGHPEDYIRLPIGHQAPFGGGEQRSWAWNPSHWFALGSSFLNVGCGWRPVAATNPADGSLAENGTEVQAWLDYYRGQQTVDEDHPYWDYAPHRMNPGEFPAYFLINGGTNVQQFYGTMYEIARQIVFSNIFFKPEEVEDDPDHLPPIFGTDPYPWISGGPSKYQFIYCMGNGREDLYKDPRCDEDTKEGCPFSDLRGTCHWTFNNWGPPVAAENSDGGDACQQFVCDWDRCWWKILMEEIGYERAAGDIPFRHNESSVDDFQENIFTIGSDVLFKEGRRYDLDTKKKVLSGIVCSSDQEEIQIDDINVWIGNNGYPDGQEFRFIPAISDSIYSFSGYPPNMTAKEHFLQMLLQGGHGIDRPMTFEEMEAAHGTHRDKFELMSIAYSVEKTMSGIDPAAKYSWFTGNPDAEYYNHCNGPHDNHAVETSALGFTDNVYGDNFGKVCGTISAQQYTTPIVGFAAGASWLVRGGSCPDADVVDRVMKNININGVNTTLRSNDKSTMIPKNPISEMTKSTQGVCVTSYGVIHCDKNYCEKALIGSWHSKKDSTYSRSITVSGSHVRKLEQAKVNCPEYKTVIEKLQLPEDTKSNHYFTPDPQTILYCDENGNEGECGHYRLTLNNVSTARQYCPDIPLDAYNQLCQTCPTSSVTAQCTEKCSRIENNVKQHECKSTCIAACCTSKERLSRLIIECLESQQSPPIAVDRDNDNYHIQFNKDVEDGPFSVSGYFPLYRTSFGAYKNSPTPEVAREGETTLGYHTHELENSIYYMPNGLDDIGQQFHGNYDSPTSPQRDQDDTSSGSGGGSSSSGSGGGY